MDVDLDNQEGNVVGRAELLPRRFLLGVESKPETAFNVPLSVSATFMTELTEEGITELKRRASVHEEIEAMDWPEVIDG